MKIVYIFFVIIGMLLNGCGSSDVKPLKKVQLKQIKTQIKGSNIVPVSSTPKWIANPDIDGNIGAVGVVKLMKNEKKQKYIAKKLAIAELQERKRVMMSSSVDKKDVVRNGKVVKSDLVQTTKQTSSHFNSDILVKKAEYSDAENYYVWMVIKK